MQISAQAQLYVGIDIGGHHHQVAITDSEGNLLDEFTLSHDLTGFDLFFSRVSLLERTTGCPALIAMEGVNGHARPLDQLILERGYPLYNVNNLKLARFKEIFQTPAKTDAIDARLIAKLLRLRPLLDREKEVLQRVATPPPEHVLLKRLTRRRRQLVEEKVMVQSRLQADLQATAPGLVDLTTSLDTRWFLNLLTARPQLSELATLEEAQMMAIPRIGLVYAGKVRQWQPTAAFSRDEALVSTMIIEDARRVMALLDLIASLKRDIAQALELSTLARTLQTIPGFGVISSAELAGEIGTLDRFPTEGSLAMYLGMAPLDRSSGLSQGGRSARQVNTRGRLAMLTGSAHHARECPESRQYYLKKRREGKKHNRAVRALGRHLIRVIWSMLHQGRAYQLRPDQGEPGGEALVRQADLGAVCLQP